MLQVYQQIKASTAAGGRCAITANTLQPFEEAVEVSPVIFPIPFAGTWHLPCQVRVADGYHLMARALEESTLLCTSTIMASCHSRAAHKGAPEDPRKKDRTKRVRKLGSILGLAMYVHTHTYIRMLIYICAVLGKSLSLPPLLVSKWRVVSLP